VHPDGTIFAIQQNNAGTASEYDSVLGIDPTTGTLKFSVPLENNDPSVNPPELDGLWYYLDLIVAGDGYAYVPYAYSQVADTVDGSVTTHFMLLRVDSSGAYDKVKIMDWTVPGPWGMQNGLTVNIITNADTGTLLTWEANPNEHFNIKRPATSGPASAMFRGRRRPGREPRAQMSPRQGYGFGSGPVTYGMAVTTGTSVSLVNAPQVPGQTDVVAPVLQAQDGSFVGTVPDPNTYNNDMVAFDAAGNVRYIVPNETPQIATADGGVIGQSGTAYDSNGNAIWQTGLQFGRPSVPGNAQPSWGAQAYTFGASGVSLDYFWFEYASSFGVLPGGNPSGNGVSVPNIGLFESLPLWQLYSTTTTSCAVGTTKAPLFPNQPNNLYAIAKAKELAFLTPPTSQCGSFFLKSGERIQYFNQLTAAVSGQKPFDGISSNISYYAAGVYTAKDREDNSLYPSFFKSHAVCEQFLRSTPNAARITVAMSQTYPSSPGAVATDVYIDSRDWIIQHLTPADILHEALDNLTGLNDADLYFLLTGLKLGQQPSKVISDVLRTNGCAPK
jgi:hypothetical protein